MDTMLNKGECPHCGEKLRKVRAEPLELEIGRLPNKRTLTAQSIHCAMCNKVLAVAPVVRSR